MKNKQIVEAWNKIEPDRDADRRMLSAILARNHSETKRRERALTMRRHFGWKVLAPVAACLVLVVAVAIPLFTDGGNGFALERSSGVKVDYADDPPPIIQKTSLAEALTEKELFADKYWDYELVAFEGVIVETRNIVCDYNGFKDYRAIATIEVQGVLRGEIKQGTTVTVLLPGPVDIEGLWVEDTGVSSKMTAGTRGIFMPIKYNERSIREENGTKLALLDLAAYGFLDGERWAFLETAAGLVYNHDSYPSLAGAKDLEDVQNRIRSRLE